MKLTKANLIALPMVIYLFFSVTAYSQNINLNNHSGKLSDIKLKLSDKQSLLKLKKDKVSYPMMDIHIGAGLANGMRVGIRYKVKYISFEGSFGFTVSLNSGENMKYVASAGFNTYPTNDWLFLSLLFSYTNSSFLVSPNIGVITIDAVNIVAFARVGASFYFRLNDLNTFEEKSFIYPNLDIGVGWRFSL